MWKQVSTIWFFTEEASATPETVRWSIKASFHVHNFEHQMCFLCGLSIEAVSCRTDSPAFPLTPVNKKITWKNFSNHNEKKQTWNHQRTNVHFAINHLLARLLHTFRYKKVKQKVMAQSTSLFDVWLLKILVSRFVFGEWIFPHCFESFKNHLQ